MQTESEFLATQAAEAQRAMADCVERMQKSLSDSADLNAWTREYPWSSVGLAAVVGFAVAASLTPTSSDKQKKQWTAFLREALAEAEARDGTPGASPEKNSALGGALSSLLRTFGTAMQSSVIAAVTAKAQQPDAPSPNGHHDPEVA